MIKRDCFAFEAENEMTNKDRCTALTKLWCREENCKFYKTRKEYERQEAEHIKQVNAF